MPCRLLVESEEVVARRLPGRGLDGRTGSSPSRSTSPLAGLSRRRSSSVRDRRPSGGAEGTGPTVTPRTSRCSDRRPVSPSAPVRASSAADGGEAGGGRAQHLGAQAHGPAPAASNAASSSGAMPPSGPTTTTIRPDGRHVDGAERRGRRPRGAPRPGRRPRPARPARRSRTAATTVGSHARRDCLPASRAVACHLAWRLRRALALPHRDRARRRPTARSCRPRSR